MSDKPTSMGDKLASKPSLASRIETEKSRPLAWKTAVSYTHLTLPTKRIV